MNKKILLGSIIAVVILFLVSFTGVVGYQITKSVTVARASPLFSVRSNRAIDKQSKDIACDYVGKGEETNIHISIRMKKTEQVQKAINIISKMDDKAFSKFVARIILHLKNQEQMPDKETSDALQVLYNMRKNPNVMKYYDTENNHIDETFEYLTCFWFPPCIITKILETLVLILIAILGWITSHTCYGYTFGTCCPE